MTQNENEYFGLKLLKNQILIRRTPDIDKIGNIFIPHKNFLDRDDYQEAEVLAIGPTKFESEISIGDRIFIWRQTGNEINYNDENLTIVRQDDIMFVLEK